MPRLWGRETRRRRTPNRNAWSASRLARAAYQSEVRGSRRLEPRLQDLVQLEVTRAAQSIPAARLAGCGKTRPINRVYSSHRGDDPGISQSLCSLPVHASSGHAKPAARASRCACFSFTQLQGPLSCDRGPSTQFRVASSCTSAWRTQLEQSRTAPLPLSAALRHLEALHALRLGVRQLQVTRPDGGKFLILFRYRLSQGHCRACASRVVKGGGYCKATA